MTFIEVHTDEKVHRWPIEDMPEGSDRRSYVARIATINLALMDFQEKMMYAFKDAKIYIVHQSKMKHVTINRSKSNR